MHTVGRWQGFIIGLRNCDPLCILNPNPSFLRSWGVAEVHVVTHNMDPEGFTCCKQRWFGKPSSHQHRCSLNPKPPNHQPSTPNKLQVSQCLSSPASLVLLPLPQLRALHEPVSKLLVPPQTTLIVVPYLIHDIIPF